MASTTFVLVSNWSWDLSNTELATITLENYEFDEIGGVENLSPARMPSGLGMAIEKIRKAQDRSVLGHNSLVALYRVTNRIELQKIILAPGKNHNVAFSLQPVCKFDDEGNPKPFLKL